MPAGSFEEDVSALAFVAGAHGGDRQGAGIMVIDMGTHVLQKAPGSHLLVQVAVPGLEERTRSTVQASSAMLQPGNIGCACDYGCIRG